MTLITKIYRSDYEVSVEELASWHAQPGAFQRLTPAWARVEVVDGVGTDPTGRLEDASNPTVWPGFHRLDARPRTARRRDRLSRSPDCRAVPAVAARSSIHSALGQPSRLEDTLIYQLPLGALGNRILSERISRNLDSLFAFRHQRTRQDLLDHGRGQLMTPERIAVHRFERPGRATACALSPGGGRDVIRLVRHRTADPGEIYWNPSTGEIDRQALEGVDAAINLAGVSIAGKRWSPARKKAIVQSRVQGTRLLAESISQLSRRPDVLISTSAVGYYGDRGSAILTEKTPRERASSLMSAWRGNRRPTAPVQPGFASFIHD